MSLFDRLKKTSGNQSEALQARLAQQGQRSYTKDARIWKWTWNDKGVSENIIRFLPIPLVDMKAQEEGIIAEDFVLSPAVMLMKHAFQGPGGWYIENSPQTNGHEDPVRDHDRPLWARQKETNDKDLKETLKKRLPDTKYYCNILVIKDGNKPENNGKVMLLEYGNAIKKILDSALTPRFSTDPSFDPFDPFGGADMLLNLFGEEKEFGNWKGLVANFNNVKWANCAPMGDDAFIEDVWSREHSLYEFNKPENFKSYEELEERLRKVLAIPAGQPLVEVGAATMAHSPNSAPVSQPQTPVQNVPSQSQAQNMSSPVADVQQPQTAAPANPTQTADLDQFEQFLKMNS